MLEAVGSLNCTSGLERFYQTLGKRMRWYYSLSSLCFLLLFYLYCQAGNSYDRPDKSNTEELN